MWEDYLVVSLDFQKLGNADFASEIIFCKAFVRYFLRTIRNRRNPVGGFEEQKLRQMEEAAQAEEYFTLSRLFDFLSDLCDTADKPVVLIIDEVDSATNNQVFLDFLAQLRSYYLDRENCAAFQSVILAGVVDVKNLKVKIHQQVGDNAVPEQNPNQEGMQIPKTNSPWNIAADFLVDMSFSAKDIQGMLRQYENDHHTGMDMELIAGLIYSYTSGYPFLVSRISQLMDERIAGSASFPKESDVWMKAGFLEAVKIFLAEKNTLFESLIRQLYEFPELKKTVYEILFSGNKIVYNPDEYWMDAALMYGFAKNESGTLLIANRIFEMRLYNYFLATSEAQSSDIFKAAVQNKSQLIHAGHLDVRRILEKFVCYFDQIYGDNEEPFDEEEGRRRFLLYLRPIINGTGNYYIEAETRNDRRMDVVVDYHGEQFIIELKVWRGNAYNERGKKQLSDYLDYFHLKKGYMLSYNFNRKKKIGVTEIPVGDRILVEAVV